MCLKNPDKWRQYNIYLIIVSFLLFSSSCTEPDVIGLEIQPKDDQLKITVTDTASLITYTVREDTLRTDETSLNLVGNYTDPVFGWANASFATQVRLPTSNVDFGTNVTFDSIVLCLAYNGFYGDTSQMFTIKVFELIESIYKDSNYYSNFTPLYNPNPLAELSFIPHPTDSVIVDGQTKQAHLRIRLNDSFGEKLLNASASGTNNMTNNNDFLNFFKGFYISSEKNGNAILYFNLLLSVSRLTLYYTDTASKSFNFIFDENCARINIFEHDYTGTIIETKLNDDNNNDSILYIQSMAGTKAKVLFPFLRNFVKSGMIIINKAELVIKVAQNESEDLYSVPNKLLLAGIDSMGKNIYIIDQFEGENYFGGSYDETNKEYRFNIARYIQEVLNGTQENRGLYILVSGSAVKADRLIVTGGNNTNRIKLILTYTKF